MPRLPSAHGFTLVEVLIALAIIAFGLTALFTTVNQTVRASDYLRVKTFANWIALNLITDARLRGQPPEDKEQGGTVEYAGQTWRWELKTLKTPVSSIVRLEARVAAENDPEEFWPGQATGFIGAAVAPPQSPRRPAGASSSASPSTRGRSPPPQPSQ